MSNSKMLIDATHPEETRVVVQRNGRVEEFDFESAARKLLRGNIYLAKVTRVEPSLQAAFVDYGGNRHGFLAFNEIHPDYYQIPVADRQALIDEEAAAEAELEAAADRRAEQMERRSRQRGGAPAPQAARDRDPGPVEIIEDDEGDEPGSEISNIVDVEEDEHIEVIGGEDGDDETPTTFAAAGVRDDVVSEAVEDRTPAEPAGSATAQEYESALEPHAEDAGHDHHHDAGEDAGSDEEDDQSGDESADADHARDHAMDDREPQPAHDNGDHADDEHGSEPSTARRSSDLLEEVPVRPRRRPRSYKIQEVIKRRQVILVQVVKEERGNKGAALTTYLSLAGRYTVLMPNTARGGGISRKITNPQDRKRLKAIAQELDVPEGMGLIIRTAGAARTKQEIKRDFEYLLRLWESVRELTLQSTAPSLVYEEGDLIKRSIRDLYNKDVEEVVVAGEAGYREAADFMRMLLPSHSKNVIEYNEPTPLFARYGVERQLNAMFSPQVTLRSGGYIVINQTEALVAIDVNSGKSTREFSIEETALATNLEAADEIARQLKLRDLAGLIVIDFIDMEEKRNNRAVERRLKDALRHDRARIQLGRISHFGLMEMSRQRLRTGVLEGSTSQCQHCQGTGIIRSTESIALAVLRGLEDAITAGAQAPLIANTTTAVALYILNSKRAYVADMEARHGYPVSVLGSDRVHGANFTIERGLASSLPLRRPERAAVNMDWGFEGEDEDAPESFESNEDAQEVESAEPVGRERGDRGERDRSQGSSEEEGGRRRKRRRRRGRRGDRDEGPRREFAPNAQNDGDDDDEDAEDAAAAAPYEDADEAVADTDATEPAPASVEQTDGNGEKRRRRRRGRRGGRRGRGERDNGEPRAGSAGEGEPQDAGGEDSEEGPYDGPGETDDVPEAPGVGPQPTIDVPAPFELTSETQAEPAQRERSDERRGRGGRGERHDRSDRERRKPERIWDVPSADAAEPVEAAAEPFSAPRERPSVETAVPEVPAETGASTNEADASSQPAAARSRRHELGSSEPRIERVVVRPDQASEGGGEPAAPQQRKGWWQRRFGG
jgi:ribonuclease E